MLQIVSVLLTRGESSREANRKGRARCGVPGADCDCTVGGRGRRPWSLDPQEQPLLPGPGNNDNKAPVHPKIATTGRREAGISVAGNAGLSPRRTSGLPDLRDKVRARVRSCTPPDAQRGIRAPAGAPPAPRRGGEKKKKERKEANDEEKRSSREFITLSSPRKRGPITSGLSRGPCSWVPAFAGTTGLCHPRAV